MVDTTHRETLRLLSLAEHAVCSSKSRPAASSIDLPRRCGHYIRGLPQQMIQTGSAHGTPMPPSVGTTLLAGSSPDLRETLERLPEKVKPPGGRSRIRFVAASSHLGQIRREECGLFGWSQLPHVGIIGMVAAHAAFLRSRLGGHCVTSRLLGSSLGGEIFVERWRLALLSGISVHISINGRRAARVNEDAVTEGGFIVETAATRTWPSAKAGVFANVSTGYASGSISSQPSWATIGQIQLEFNRGKEPTLVSV